jgi:hypothetical protein
MNTESIVQQEVPFNRTKFLSTEGAIDYIKDIYGIQIAKATLYKKRSLEKGAFIGHRSPFGKLVFDTKEIDRYMMSVRQPVDVKVQKHKPV